MRLPVLFDGGCPLCRRTVRIVRALDWNDRLQFVDATNAEAREFFAPSLTEAQVMVEMYVVDERQRLHGGFEGFLQISRVIPLLWPFGLIARLPGIRQLGHVVYKVIAANRVRRGRCTDDICEPGLVRSKGSKGSGGHTSALLAMTVIVGSAGFADRVAYAEQKPVQEREVGVDFFAPPHSLTEMVREVDAVVVVRYTGRGQVIEDSGLGSPRTNHAFVVNEIVKPDPLVPSVGDELTLAMIGGDREFATHVLRYRIAHIDELRRGGKYVLFLRHTPMNTLLIAWGANGVYEVTDRTVQALQREFRRYDGTSTDAFIEALRRGGPLRGVKE